MNIDAFFHPLPSPPSDFPQGANSPLGIGRAAAHAFASASALAVYICDFNDEHLSTHKKELNSLYPATEIHTRQLDAAKEAQVQEVVKHALDTYGRLDVFFANAGIVGDHTPFIDGDGADYMEVMRVNALSVYLAAKHAAPAMQVVTPGSGKVRANGSVIATASVAGIRSNAGSTAYSASKAAVVSMMQTCAYQASRTGVRFNAICPGLIETGMTDVVFEMARQRGTEGKIGQINPLGRGGVADEIARVALFLGSEEASYVNGQAWAVDGGLSAGHPYVIGKMA